MTPRPRILLLVKGLSSGGAQRVIVDAVDHFDRERFAYEVAFVVDTLDDLVPHFERLGVPAHRLRGRGWPVRLHRLVGRRGIALVHGHSPLITAGARLVLRVPIVYTEHSVWAGYHPVTRLANALTFRRNAHVFAVSRAVARSTRSPRAEVLYHGVDVEPAAFAPNDPPVVGTVGGLIGVKGHRFLLEAAARVPEARFVVVGGGALEDELRRAAPANVEFTGHRARADRLTAGFDVFVLPSLHEGLPLALLEAMAHGRPIVATRTGGVPELLEDGRSGLLVEPGEPEALAGAINRLLDDPALRARLGAAARERAQRFDSGSAARRMEQIYAELVG